jgi:hypothetical protein
MIIAVFSFQSVTFKILNTSFENLIVRFPRFEILCKSIIAGSWSSVYFVVSFYPDSIAVSEVMSNRCSFKTIALVTSVVFFVVVEVKLFEVKRLVAASKILISK